jgi:UTP--glucose-1-phosphate uridylyltransferase
MGGGVTMRILHRLHPHRFLSSRKHHVYKPPSYDPMDIRKAVITAAGKSQRTLPLQSLVDRDGQTKTALGIIIEEILRAGIEAIGVIISPGDEAAYRTAAGIHSGRLTFIEQPQPLGYAHAVHCASGFCGGDAFLLLVGDHLYLSATEKGCAQQLVEVARTENCAVSAVQSTHESKLPFYGAVGGQLVDAQRRLYQVDTVLEKPTPTEAEQKIDVPGLRAGYYLCFFGMHVLTPTVHHILAETFAAVPGRESSVNFRAILDRLADRERYLACELDGRRYDFGVKYGLLTAQLALGLGGRDRDEVLRGLVELLAAERAGR